MPIVIDELVVDVPSSESTAPAAVGAGALPAAPAWSAALARALEEQLRLSIERRERLLAD
jgi:hypothetical protein